VLRRQNSFYVLPGLTSIPHFGPLHLLGHRYPTRDGWINEL
jgi:hypothetical protein